MSYGEKSILYLVMMAMVIISAGFIGFDNPLFVLVILGSALLGHMTGRNLYYWWYERYLTSGR